MRERMPKVADHLDALREAFGAEVIDEAIRAGMRGEKRFWAQENNEEVGTPWR